MPRSATIFIEDTEPALQASSSGRAEVDELVPTNWHTSSGTLYKDCMGPVISRLVTAPDLMQSYMALYFDTQARVEWMRGMSRAPDVIRVYDYPRSLPVWTWALPVLGYRPIWFQDAVETMLDLMRLEDNWNSHGGLALRQEFAEKGLRILQSIGRRISEKPFIYPSATGGLVVEIDRRPKRITFIIDTGVGLVHTQGDEEPASFDLSTEEGEAEMLRKLEQILAA